MFGWSRAEVLDTPMRQFVPADVLAHFETVWTRLAAGSTVPTYDTDRLHRDGTRTPVSVHAVAIRERGTFAGTVATFREQPGHHRVRGAVPRRVAVSQVHEDRTDDDLTGLLGRRGLQRRLAGPVPAGMARAVAVLDVDAFALVNQTYGPDVGDDVLRELGRRLDAIADGAVAGRWQADEFIYVVDAPDPAAAIDAIVAAALQAVREPLTIGDQRVYLTVSAGLAATALAADCDLFTAATRALRAAKAAGRDRAVWFNAALRPASGGLRLANDLRRGIDCGEMRLHYQPIVELTHYSVVGVEALVRWERPGVGLLTPGAFIDVAERTGQIVPLGAWVTDQACRTAVRLAELGTGAHSMSINLSARQLSDTGVRDMLRKALSDSGCPPSNIVVEVTETALMQDMRGATATLEAIKALGVALALDDFGTGYSSLLYLKSFPVDRIKIDRSFVSGLGIDADDTAIVASTISLAHSVGVQAVAEGVETVDQLTLLRQMGCDFAQGYLFSRPLSLGQLEHWLGARLPAPRRRKLSPKTTTTAPETSRILRLHGEGASLHTIAAALNVEGLHTALGVRWSPQSIAAVITRSRFPTLGLPSTRRTSRGEFDGAKDRLRLGDGSA